MITTTRVAEVRRLLAEEKLSQRKIAKLLGMSRGTVNTIAAGKWRDRERCDEVMDVMGPPERCPSCGGMVYMPCRLCEVRKVATRTDKPGVHPVTVHHGDAIDEAMRFNLRPEHQARYEAIRRAREAGMK
jgi:transcriptional regulator with XRE-family HTH domain